MDSIVQDVSDNLPLIYIVNQCSESYVVDLDDISVGLHFNP